MNPKRRTYIPTVLLYQLTLAGCIPLNFDKPILSDNEIHHDLMSCPQEFPLNKCLKHLPNINFESNSAHLSFDAKITLNSVAYWMVHCSPDAQVQVEGHCDERGTNEYNFALGQTRAKVVVDYLLNYGVEPKRLEAISYGEELPTEEGSSETAFSKNRRVLFYIPTRKAGVLSAN